MIYFTADWHLGHTKLLRMLSRPFEDDTDYMFHIVGLLRSLDRQTDRLYILGDVFWKKEILEEVLPFFPIETHIILGNHDHKLKNHLKRVKSVSQIKGIEIDGQYVVLCHYPMRAWNRSHYGAWQLHGHSHGKMRPYGYQLDVGVDVHKFEFVSWERIKDIMMTERKGENPIMIIS